MVASISWGSRMRRKNSAMYELIHVFQQLWFWKGYFFYSFLTPNQLKNCHNTMWYHILKGHCVISLQQMLQGGPAVDTIIYDMVLEAAMRAQSFNSKMLHISGSWKWLLDEFADYYGVSDAYRKLRWTIRLWFIDTELWLLNIVDHDNTFITFIGTCLTLWMWQYQQRIVWYLYMNFFFLSWKHGKIGL